ncbi:helix-turn-helix transcriptional regulator [Paenibacillus sp. FSL E2-0178]|uniref:helix-turn-helix domain-containing protein n=1 Tax=Paenibacillus sp. FSL E2-0178 TaxID=2921361 RepID=UPI0031583327
MFKPERLEKWRRIRKLTQEELATKINMTKAAVSNYENGHSSPSGDTLAALADVLDIDTDYLLDRTDTPRHLNQLKYEGNSDETFFERKELIEMINKASSEDLADLKIIVKRFVKEK